MTRRRRLRVLITAGPTREYIDPVRFLSNDSSGRMGFALADAAARDGCAVTLVHGPVSLPTPAGVRCVPVVSADEMLRACRRLWARHDVLIKAAAVADYRPAKRSRSKLKKSATALVLELEPTVDILADLSSRRRAGQIVVGFALEDRHARRRAADKLSRKNLDAIVLNGPQAIAADRAVVHVLVRGGRWRSIGPTGKRQIAERLLALILALARPAE